MAGGVSGQPENPPGYATECASLSCVKVSHLAKFILLNNCSHMHVLPKRAVSIRAWFYFTRPGHLSCGIHYPYNFTSSTSANLDFKSPSHCRSTSSICRWTGTFITIASNGFANNAKSWLRARSSANRLANWSRSFPISARYAAASANWMNKNCSVQLSKKYYFSRLFNYILIRSVTINGRMRW